MVYHVQKEAYVSNVSLIVGRNHIHEIDIHEQFELLRAE